MEIIIYVLDFHRWPRIEKLSEYPFWAVAESIFR